MSDEDHVLLCMSLKDMPTPAVSSKVRYCNGCGQKVWVDRRLYARLVAEHGRDQLRLLCIPCQSQELLRDAEVTR